MISGMDVKEDDESYMNAVDYMFKGLESRKPDTLRCGSTKNISWPAEMYALSDFLIMVFVMVSEAVT